VVNSSQGGGSKDTWVLDAGEDEPLPPLEPELVVDDGGPTFTAAALRRAALDSRGRLDQPAVHSERMRQQEEQQQQGGATC
jgi:hypothetical protein